MKTVDCLEPHESQLDRLSFFDLLLRELQELSGFGLLGIFDIVEPERRAVHKQLDALWCLG